MAGRPTSNGIYRFLLVLVTLILVGTILAATGVWNPVPAMQAWWHQLTKLSEPEPAWTARLGSEPDVVAALPTGQIVAASFGTVTAYTPSGVAAWSYPAYWALPARDVVVIRSKPTNRNQTNDKGYTVLDAVTGATLWSDQQANAVWAFADEVVELQCPDAGGCELRGRSHRDGGTVLWRALLPAAARSLKGPAPGLVGLRDPADWFAAAAAGMAVPTPSVLALRVEGTIQLIDTSPPGRRVREIAPGDPQTRLTFAGQRVLVAHSAAANSGCRYTLEGRSFATDTVSWSTSKLDLGTGSGTVCEQRDDPVGAAGRIEARDFDDRPVLVNATDGRVVWTGVAGESVLATDGEIAVVLGADRVTVRVIDLIAPDARPRYTGRFGLEPQAAVTATHVVIRDADAERIVVLDHFVGPDGTLRLIAEVKTRASVAAIGSRALILTDGRTIGYLPLFSY